jgi:hypothetical protein
MGLGPYGNPAHKAVGNLDQSARRAESESDLRERCTGILKGRPAQHYGFLVASACCSKAAAALLTVSLESESAERRSDKPAWVCATL